MNETPNPGDGTTDTPRPCRLCQTPIPRRMRESEFCCAGCEKVFDILGRLDDDAKPAYLETARKLGLIPDGGASQGTPDHSGQAASAPPFKKGAGGISAETDGAIEEEDKIPLAPFFKGERGFSDTKPDPGTDPDPSLDPALGQRRERLDMSGLMCPSCGWVAEQVLASTDGVTAARVDYFSSSCDVQYDLTKVSRDVLQEALAPLGYGLARLSDRETTPLHRKATHRFLVVAILAMNVMSLSFLRYFQTLGVLDHLPSFIPWLEGALVLPILYIGWIPVVHRAVASLRHGRLTMDLLIAIGVGAAATLSAVSLFTGREDMYFETCAGLLTISLLSGMIEARLRDKAFASLAPLMKTRLVHARRVDADGDDEYVKIDDIRSGDRVRFQKGELVPFDGVVESASAVVSEAMLTGEPHPIAKSRGDRMTAGSEVVEGRVVLLVERLFEETLLAKIAGSVGETLAKQEQRLRQNDRIASFFIPAVVLIAVGAWLYRLHAHGLAFALTPDGWFPSISVLAVACPCAFSLAGISAVTAVVGALLKRGFLVKELNRLEALAKVDHVIFDKTGTVTWGRMTVEHLVWRTEPDPALLSLVRAAEARSDHPVAEAVRAYLHQMSLPAGERAAVDIEDVPGSGRRAAIDGKTISIGNAALFEAPFAPEGLEAHHTAVWFGFGKTAAGCFLLTDEIRESAEPTVAKLRANGLSCELVSGDRAEVTRHVAAAIGLDSATGGASIEDKVAIVKQRRAAGRLTAFVGDGTNDALAMAEAGISIALARSTDEALSASDLVAIHGDIERLDEVFTAGRKLASVVKQNYLWAFSFNSFFIPIAAMGKLVPLAAMLLMLASSIAVLLNSLRLR